MAEVCGALKLNSADTSFQMQKYIPECYLRLIGRPIMQLVADIRCFLAECQRSIAECQRIKIIRAQVGFDIPSDQTLFTRVSKGLTSSDMECVLDFFKRRTQV